LRVVDEGGISLDGFEIWYRIVGDSADAPPGGLPVLALHGGPGPPHESLEPLSGLARDGRPVVFYDQLGCGNSERFGDPDRWSVELFLYELAAVRRRLGLERVHLLGHSWGDMLAIEHAMGGAEGIASLTLVGAVLSGPMVFESRRRFYEKLPPALRDAALHSEATGDFEDLGYAEAMDAFYKRYA
jgi:proline-specific peptidase